MAEWWEQYQGRLQMDIKDFMMYRVFLLGGENNPPSFKIGWGEINTWTFIPSEKPDLEKQIGRVNDWITIKPYEGEFNGHILMVRNFSPIDIVHKGEDVYDRFYNMAFNEAEQLTGKLIMRTKKPYYLLNLTPRGDRKEAEKLSKLAGSNFLALLDAV